MPKASREEVREHFKMINDLFFGGLLHPTTPVHWVAASKFYGDYEGPGEEWPYGRIRLSSRLPEGVTWQQVLLHECVHLYLSLLEPHCDEYETGTVEYHGPRFTEEVNRISRELGLPPVSQENAWYWPYEALLNYHPEPV